MNPSNMDSLLQTHNTFILDLLFSPHRCVREQMSDALTGLLTQAEATAETGARLRLTKELLVSVSETLAMSYPCVEYFHVLIEIVRKGIEWKALTAPEIETMLRAEVAWLARAQEYTASKLESYPNEALLRGHLELTTQLVSQSTPAEKAQLGTAPDGPGLLRHLLDDFSLPPSRMYVQMKGFTTRIMDVIQGRTEGGASQQMPRSQTELPLKPIAELQETAPPDPTLTRSATTNLAASSHCIPVCPGASSLGATYDLLVELCAKSEPNLRALADRLVQMFYADPSEGLSEWEYLPPVGLRPQNGFVGIKNGGATCYMNSVLQQFFVNDCLRERVLAMDVMNWKEGDSKKEDSEKVTYNLGLVWQLQTIFGHLLGSQLQFYTPKAFWRHFRFQNEAINLREQHDSVEFLDHIVDGLDEAAKALKQPPLSSDALSGVLSDQKVCKDCPHRYSKDAPFTYLSVDIRNATTLDRALEDYVRGEMLEGADAYHCEACATKVDAVKRLCIKKLPRVLVIQLKRFDYDWERDLPVKFNDYFEFPRELTMEPYTVHGLAKKEGELVAVDQIEPIPPAECRYSLSGVVVHSGLATGGHYYSYIRTTAPGTAAPHWFKFDDMDVSPVDMDEDEELRNLCFGGDTSIEQLMKGGMRRQKRWFNAYILFYEQTYTSVISKLSKMSIGMKLREIRQT